MKRFIAFLIPPKGNSIYLYFPASSKAVAAKRAQRIVAEESRLDPFYRTVTIVVESLTLKKAKAIYATYKGRHFLQFDWMCTVYDYAADVLYDAQLI